MEGKRKSGLSVPDYIKKILREHFEGEGRQDSQKRQFEQFRKELLKDVESTILELINAGSSGIRESEGGGPTGGHNDTKLPERGEEISKEALSFLNRTG